MTKQPPSRPVPVALDPETPVFNDVVAARGLPPKTDGTTAPVLRILPQPADETVPDAR